LELLSKTFNGNFWSIGQTHMNGFGTRIYWMWVEKKLLNYNSKRGDGAWREKEYKVDVQIIFPRA